MTTITGTHAGTSAQPANPATNSVLANSDFETFIKMLTVQAQNQDPLNPMDSSDYATQLATFSGVEQQVQTNTLLNALISLNGQSQLSQLADWVGMEGQLAGHAVYDGASVTLHGQGLNFADQVEMVITSLDGTELRRLALDPAAGQVVWDGRDAAGGEVPEGAYMLRVESYVDGVLSQTQPGHSWAAISEARLGPTGVQLVLPAGAVIEAALVTGLRSPRAS